MRLLAVGNNNWRDIPRTFILTPSATQTGNVKGTQVNDTVTYVGRPTSIGVLSGEGQGVIMAGESEIVTYKGYGVGKITASGGVS